MKEEEIKREIETKDFYVHPESSTGSNGQINSARQNNYLMFFISELNKNISKLDKDINAFRKDIETYNTKNERSTKWIIILTIMMAVLAIIQVIFMLYQQFRWF